VSEPVCTIIAGPNGAGKTTFALNYLSEVTHCRRFINADLIASGLSPLSPELEQVAASRLFLGKIRQAVERKEDFAFETTLSGRAHLRRIRDLQENAWRVELIYLYLPDVEMSIERVAERVRHGGHDIPLQSILRRYPRSLNNLLNLYAPLCDSTICMDNSSETPKLVFTQTPGTRSIEAPSIYEKLVAGSKQ
jgi:predicted ABC-type ATPase